MVKTTVMTTQMKYFANQSRHQLHALQRNLRVNFPDNAYLYHGFVIMIVTAGDCSTLEQKYI